MKKIAILFISVFISGFLLLSAPLVHAMTPVLSVSSTGSGDNMQINVTGDPNVSILLFAGSQLPVLGTTDSSGNFSTVISSATYGIVPNEAVYIKTNGINGDMSNQVVWPYFQNTTTNTNLTLSQTALLLNIGQTSTITASANYLYVSSNSTPSVANVNLNANQITIQALAYGSTTVNICAVGSTTNCANVSVTVQNSGAQQLSFSQNNFSIVSGQNVSVAVTGGSGTYAVTNNSNTNAVTATSNGSSVNLTASGTVGAASITVCTTDMTDCGIINVDSTNVNSTAVTFSQTNPVVPVGQSTTVTIYGGDGSNFYVSSNSNPSIVQANISGNILTLIGNATTGTSNIGVCAYAGTCASLVANVSSATNGSAISLSQSAVSILAGQSSNITILGGSTPYSISSSNNSADIFNSDISGNILTIYGVNPGSATASICAAIGCTTLNITINSTTSTNNAPPTFSQNNILLNIGQQLTVNVAGTGNYYISANSVPTVASEQISGSSINISAMQIGTTNLNVCQSDGQCATLYITVSGPTAQTTTTLPQGCTSTFGYSPLTGQSCATGVTIPTATSTYVFPRYLGYGDKGDDVLMLQKILIQQGFFSATPNGHYGPATKVAVQKFQKAHGINQTGNVGQLTKGALDQVSTYVVSTTSTTKAQEISDIQAEIQQLMAQIAQIQGQ